MAAFRSLFMRTIFRFAGLVMGLALSANALNAQPAPTRPAAPTTAATTSTKPAALSIVEADNAKTLHLDLHKTAVISLAGNATTGYSWSVVKMDGTALEQVGAVEYVPDRSRPGMVGSGGTSVATFRAVKAGQSTVTLGYARPWENGTPPTKTFTITLIVDPAP
jgi:inhibitor of cysteine peptidase